MTNIRPLHDNVIIRPIEGDDKTAGGIILTSKEKPDTGVVVATGPGKLIEGVNVETGVVTGNKVFYKKYTGTTFTLNGEQLLILPAENILGVIVEE